jgi:nucleoside-diphosphate-sugar epimerase
MEGCDAVINCAKFPEGEEVNRTMMGGLIDAARQVGVKKMIHFSSMAAFGAVRGDVINEDTAPVAPFSAYGRDKLMTEQVCAEKAGNGLSISRCVRHWSMGRAGRSGTNISLARSSVDVCAA